MGLQLVSKLDVKVTSVLGVGLDVELDLDILVFADGKHVLEIEDSLLPVGVLGVGASREADGLVAGGEVDIEPRDKSVDEVISLSSELKVSGESQVGGGAGVKIESENGGRVGDDGLEFDGIDEGLGQSSLLQGAIIKAIDVVPDWKTLVMSEFGRFISTYSQSSHLCSLHPQYRRRRWWPYRGR